MFIMNWTKLKASPGYRNLKKRGFFLYGILSIILLSVSSCTEKDFNQDRTKPRIVVTTDPELDDSNSLIRFLLYSTDYKIEGLIYASSQFHWKGDGKGTKLFVPGREYTRFGLNFGPMESWRWAEDERFIHNAVEAYKEVYPNLKVHDPDYPDPEILKSKIRFGNVAFDGDISEDSEGSELIKSLILDSIPGPLYITAWGGQSTIARALKSIQMQFENTPDWNNVRKKISSKVIILPSGDQDDTYANYIKPNWPEIGYWMFSGGVGLSYNAQARATSEDAFYYSPDWMKENITSKGPLGALYRVWGDGKQMVNGDIFDYFGLQDRTEEELRKMGYIVWTPVLEQGAFLGEGDTFTFLNILDNGLRAYEDPGFGGWSGRKRAQERNTSFQFSDSLSFMALMRRDTVIPNFLPEVQNSFAARMKWSVSPEFQDANHEPVADIKGSLNINAQPVERIKLRATVIDPDGDTVTVKWWQFRTGTYPGHITFSNNESVSTEVIIPSDAVTGQTIHLILEATDNGSPALKSYQRIIVTVCDSDGQF
jgi:hypothetical protein